MKEQFIPYEQALEFKELGFNEQCMRFWSSKNGGTLVLPQRINNMHNTVNSSTELAGYCSAPLWQQAFDWFREKHNILGNVYANASGYLFEWHDAEGGTHRGDSDFDGPNDGGVWDTYQEAREALLIRLISIIKKS